MFPPDAQAEQMMLEVLAYPHPVIIALVFDGHLFAVQLSDSHRPESPPGRDTIRVDQQTVGEILRSFRSLARAADGSVEGVELEFSLAGDRHLVLT